MPGLGIFCFYVFKVTEPELGGWIPGPKSQLDCSPVVLGLEPLDPNQGCPKFKILNMSKSLPPSRGVDVI